MLLQGASWRLLTAVGHSRICRRAIPSISQRTYTLLSPQKTQISAAQHITHGRCIVPPLSSSTRSLSTDSSFYSVIHIAENSFQALHSLTHLPWWGVVIVATVVLRSALTLPLAVHQNRIIAKMELLLPTLKEYQEAVKHNVVVKCRRENLPVEEANRRLRKAVRKTVLIDETLFVCLLWMERN